MRASKFHGTAICLIFPIVGCSVFSQQTPPAISNSDWNSYSAGDWCHVTSPETRTGLTKMQVQHIGRIETIDDDSITLSNVTSRNSISPVIEVPFSNRIFKNTGVGPTQGQVTVPRHRISDMQREVQHDPQDILGMGPFGQSSIDWKKVDENGDGHVSEAELHAARRMIDAHQQSAVGVPVYVSGANVNTK